MGFETFTDQFFAIRIFGSFGATVAIVALACSPFAQQTATYRTRVVQADTVATIPMALNYTGVLPGDGITSKPFSEISNLVEQAIAIKF